MTGVLVASVGVLLANLIVFGLSLKLYTEILKDQSQNRRATAGQAEGPVTQAVSGRPLPPTGQSQPASPKYNEGDES